MTDTAPEAMQTEDMSTPDPDAISRELAIAQRQRNSMGEIAAHWIGRFYGLKAANGELPPASLVPAIERELREIDAIMQSMAQPNG